MQALIEKKILDITEQLGAMETEHLYWNKPAWKTLKDKQDILREVLSELKVTRAVHLQETAKREVGMLGRCSVSIAKELELLIDNFNELEQNAFIRLTGPTL